MNENEIWKPVLGFEEQYEVSNFGRIRSFVYFQGHSINGLGKIIKPGKCKKYLTFKPYRKSFYLHRIVWEAFNGPIPEKLQINHIDENTFNNRLDNLELMSCKQNNNYGNHCKNISDAHSIPVNQFDKEGNFIKTHKNSEEAAKAVNLSSGSNIRACCLNLPRHKTAGGYLWKYAEKRDTARINIKNKESL